MAAIETTYRDALRQALIDAMTEDASVFVMGEEVGRYGGAYGVTKGLLEMFGEHRIVDTPIAEPAIIGAAVGGSAGVLYASKVMVISPDMFKFDVSILILACVVFGGIGNIWGVALGAALLAYLPERIRFISDARQLVFGLVLIIMMNMRPDGLLPRKKREKITEKGAK